MNKDTLKGSATSLKGDIKKAAGKAVGDHGTTAEGVLDKVAGAVQKGAGELKEKVEKVARDLKK